MNKETRMAAVAWLLAALYYFYQYIMRSSPSVMMTELSEVFGLSSLGVASMVGLFYYGYSPFSLVAGVAMDRLGPRKVVPFGAAAVGIGAILFSTGNQSIGNIGRLLQGAGGVFALIGAVYIASKYFPPSKAATLIGATQMFGMAGGSAGQFAVGPIISKGIPVQTFWLWMGIAGLGIGLVLWFLLPKEEKKTNDDNWVKSTVKAFGIVFKNPQSILCGLIAGLMFIPTTIFDMVWGVRFLQEAIGYEYGSAVLRSASVPFGWIIGCPLMGYLSDRIGRRKPVIIVGAFVLLLCLTWVLFGKSNVFPAYSIGLLAGISSGAAMLPYTVIKESNPKEYGGTATGVINFINFTFSAILGPVFAWILTRVSGSGDIINLTHFRITFMPLLIGVVLAIILTFLLKETGSSAKRI